MNKTPNITLFTYSGGTDAQDKAVNGRKADLYEVHEKRKMKTKVLSLTTMCRFMLATVAAVWHVVLFVSILSLDYVSEELKKGLMDVRQESSLILSVVSKGR